jgi:hypothetical protein
MTATAEQQTIDTVTRTIETPLGFRLRIPIGVVHLGQIRRPDGTHQAVIWRNAERLLQEGYGIDMPTRNRGHLRVEFYARCLTRSMVHALARLKRYHDDHPESEWANRRDFGGPSHGDWARLRFRGLIEQRPSVGSNAFRGWWRLTGLGHQWLRGNEKIPRQIVVLDSVPVGFLDPSDLISVTDVDDDFSYESLRGTRAPAVAS